MKKFIEILAKEKKKYEAMLKVFESYLPIELEGKLVISDSDKLKFYRQFTDENGKRKREYISTKDHKMPYLLAQKTYLEEVGRFLDMRLKNIDRLLKDYSQNDIDEIYMRMHPQRQKLVNPIVKTSEEKIQNWKDFEHAKSNHPFSEFEIYSRRGERVRSKSEKILVDIFDEFGLVYKYEKALQLSDRVVFPDFTFYDPVNDREIYWEHFGMMDNPEYLHNAIIKLEAYINNSIFPGDQLLFSFETSKKNINYKLIKSMIKKYLL